MREAVGKGEVIMPSATKRAGPDASLDVPLHFKGDEWSFDQFDAMTFAIADAPAQDAIVITVAVTNRGDHWPELSARHRGRSVGLHR